MYEQAKIRSLLEKVFDEMYSESRNKKSARYQEFRRDFGFHMTDWLEDLKELHDVFKNPDKYSGATACRQITGILYHVIPHLSAAGRILLEEIPDAFAHLYHVRKRNVSKNSKKTKVKHAG